VRWALEFLDRCWVFLLGLVVFLAGLTREPADSFGLSLLRLVGLAREPHPPIGRVTICPGSAPTDCPGSGPPSLRVAHANPIWTTYAYWGQGRALRETDPASALDTLREGLAHSREHRSEFLEAYIERDAAVLEAIHGDIDHVPRPAPR
jgi:hypothetical protein